MAPLRWRLSLYREESRYGNLSSWLLVGVAATLTAAMLGDAGFLWLLLTACFGSLGELLASRSQQRPDIFARVCLSRSMAKWWAMLGFSMIGLYVVTNGAGWLLAATFSACAAALSLTPQSGAHVVDSEAH